MDFGQRLEQAAAYARRIVLKIIRDETITEDVLQTAKLNAWRHRGTFQGKSAFNTWFTTIARNEALMHLRYQRSRGGAHLPLDVSVPDPAPDPEARLLRAEHREQLVTAILGLRHAQRRELLLYSNGVIDPNISLSGRKANRKRGYDRLREVLPRRSRVA